MHHLRQPHSHHPRAESRAEHTRGRRNDPKPPPTLLKFSSGWKLFVNQRSLFCTLLPPSFIWPGSSRGLLQGLHAQTRTALHFQIKGTPEYPQHGNTNRKIPAVRVVGALRNMGSRLVMRREIGERGILER